MGKKHVIWRKTFSIKKLHQEKCFMHTLLCQRWRFKMASNYYRSDETRFVCSLVFFLSYEKPIGRLNKNSVMPMFHRKNTNLTHKNCRLLIFLQVLLNLLQLPQPADSLKKYEIKHTPNKMDILKLKIWVEDKMSIVRLK